ncbi:ubiquitin carboxyl-terminal hydrolase 35-like isoform X2 [Bolinopsis microptera]|uniref:ubiquitin carboxyl-terminal hydrolase 35-like isoform X2 n=1 Tax=Bolinopsis microptera TaxID=2820187 RepID=UPI0030790DBE
MYLDFRCLSFRVYCKRSRLYQKVRKLQICLQFSVKNCVHPERVISGLSRELEDHNNRECITLASKLIVKSLKRSQLSLHEGKKIGAILSNNKLLTFSGADIRVIIGQLHNSKHWFSDTSSWLETYFYYSGLTDQTSDVSDQNIFTADQVSLVTTLKLIASKLASGDLSLVQGSILSNIKDRTIVDTASQEFLDSLTESNISKCFDNLLALQIQGLVLSHWIIALTELLSADKRFMLVIQLSERLVESILAPRTGITSPDSLELVCQLLLLHQHSPFLFHRHFTKLVAFESEECIKKTLQCMMLKYPHFGRLYGKTRNSYMYQWHELQSMLASSDISSNRGVGFNNLGNTCYFNSLVQAMWLSVPFQMDVIFNRAESSILSELRRVFLNLSYSVRQSFSPDTLFHVLRPPWFSFGSQQDSAELLRHMFDLISSGSGPSGTEPTNPLQEGLAGGRDLGSLESSKYRQYYSANKDINTESQPSQIITKNFQGVQEVTIVCDTCDTASSKEEPFLFLSLPCGKETTSLEDLITSSLATEHLSQENQYHCETCTTKSDAVRKTTLNKMPNTFIFTINRFSYNKELKCRSKLLTKVQIPATLRFTAQSDSTFTIGTTDITDTTDTIDTTETTDTNDTTTDVVYQLYGTLVHSGSTTESGHYYTYGVPSSYSSLSVLSHCLCFNDSRVTYVNEDLVNSPRGSMDTPYLLFYQRLPTEQPPQDLDVGELSEILSSNVRWLQQQVQSQVVRQTGSKFKEPPSKDEDDDDSNKDIYSKGCHDNEFATGSSRFIY